MYITIGKKDLKIVYANTFLKKLIGLSFKKNIYYGMLFKTCSIQTFFMRCNIDLCLLSKDYKIIKLVSNFKPGKILIDKNCYYILELPINCNKYLKVSEKLKIKG